MSELNEAPSEEWRTTIRLYQEDDHWYGIMGWTASGPGCTVSGHKTEEEALAAYRKNAALNGVDVDSLRIVRGSYQKVWVEN